MDVRNCEECWRATINIDKVLANDKWVHEIRWPGDFDFTCDGMGCDPLISDIKPWRPWTIKPEKKPSVPFKFQPLNDGITPTFFGG